MSFMFFKKIKEDDKLYYLNDYATYSLAGKNLIYQTWKRLGKPVNSGWSITANDLLETYAKEYEDDTCTGENYALLIDFHPSSNYRIALIEIERIHLYTYASNNGTVEWSPLMLELRKVYYEDEIEEFTKEYKEETLNKIEIYQEREQIIEFLYLNGDDHSWNWGRNGMTNAAFISDKARDFFRQYF